MRDLLHGLWLVPGVVGGLMLPRGGGAVERDAPVAAVERALAGDFYATPRTTAHGTLPTQVRRACAVEVPGVGRALYVEDRFSAARTPYRQAFFVVRSLGSRGVRVDALSPEDHAAARGLCDRPNARFDGALTLRPACALEGEVAGEAGELRTRGARCADVLNGAAYAEESLALRDGAVVQTRRGLTARGEVAYGDGASIVWRRSRAAR